MQLNQQSVSKVCMTYFITLISNLVLRKDIRLTIGQSILETDESLKRCDQLHFLKVLIWVLEIPSKMPN